VSKSVDVAKLAFAVEYLLRPFARNTKGFGKGTQKLDDLSDVIIILAIFGAGLRIKEVIASNEFEDLKSSDKISGEESEEVTIAAILQTSVLAPHLAPRMTSGERY
jgi:hypothetical protein